MNSVSLTIKLALEISAERDYSQYIHTVGFHEIAYMSNLCNAGELKSQSSLYTWVCVSVIKIIYSIVVT